MSVLTFDLAALPLLSIAQLCALPPTQLHGYHASLQALQHWLEQAQARLNAALTLRYGETARDTLADAGREFGATSWVDGPMRIRFELSQQVDWDQQQLARLAERLAARGESVQRYIDTVFSIPEDRFHHWPLPLRRQFASARSVTTLPPTFQLTLHEV